MVARGSLGSSTSERGPRYVDMDISREPWWIDEMSLHVNPICVLIDAEASINKAASNERGISSKRLKRRCGRCGIAQELAPVVVGMLSRLE